jgi:hypothetical protein
MVGVATYFPMENLHEPPYKIVRKPARFVGRVLAKLEKAAR